MVGGYSFSLSNFNRATQAMRQPGSAFKPIVYATALENDFTPASIITDAPMNLKGANGETWSPENYYHKFYGAQPMRKGLELSINGMTVRLAQDVGMRKVSDMAIKLGVVDQMEPVLAMALGAGETTPFRLTAAYASFVNGGRKIQPHLIELVENMKGDVIYQADKRPCGPCKAGFNGDEGPRLTPTGEQVMDPITAYQITSMLQGVVQRGTGAAVSSLGYPLAGKTGTTNDYRSAWFMGFSPNMVVGVFVGFDDNRSLGEGETGAQDAVPIFISFMKEALKGKPKVDFVPPKEAKFITVAGIREAFRPGTEPRGPSGPVAPKPEGPVLYNQAWPDGKLKEDQTPPPPTAKPPPKPKIPDDLTGLY
jgi:penicillin-binding protein 1A